MIEIIVLQASERSPNNSKAVRSPFLCGILVNTPDIVSQERRSINPRGREPLYDALLVAFIAILMRINIFPAVGRTNPPLTSRFANLKTRPAPQLEDASGAAGRAALRTCILRSRINDGYTVEQKGKDAPKINESNEASYTSYASYTVGLMQWVLRSGSYAVGLTQW